ncbi:hypothetical protein GGI02_003915, partial [Coemansia sp. RSA 2322]
MIKDKVEKEKAWKESGDEFLKSEGYVIREGYRYMYFPSRVRTYILYGKGVYVHNQPYELRDDDTELLVAKMKNGVWKT